MVRFDDYYSSCCKLLVTALIFWTNVRFSIGQESGNETESTIDWDYETIVAVRWDIDNPPIVEYDKLRFDIQFSVSDYIEADKHVRYDIYQNAECGNAGDIITDSDGYMESYVTEDDTPVGPGIDENAKRTVTVSNQLVAQTISQSESYTETTTGTGNIEASITYCVRLSLWNGDGPTDPSATEINHLAVTVGLSLDLTDEDFSIKGQKVEALEKSVETSSDQFFVEAFVCDETGKPPTLVSPLQQGDPVRICIEPTEQAAEVGFRMQRIEKFTFVQGMTSQQAILNQEVSSNSLTDLTCVPGAKQCVFETLLFAYFFENSPQATVIGEGEATLQWGGEGFRRLQFHLDSQIAIGTDNMEEEDGKEEVERLLQQRSSTKSIQIPTFAILSDEKERPQLLAKSKKAAARQRSILITLIVILCAVLLLPLAYCFGQRYRQRQQRLREPVPVPDLENEPVFDIEIIPDDQSRIMHFEVW